MDRRVVAGLVGLVLVGGAEVCPAQTGPAKDPSAQPAVGLSPLPSINDTINNASLGSLPPAYAKPPTSPIGNGPAAAIPRPPVLNAPVGLSPIEPIHQSINRGSGIARISAMFRKPGPRASAPANAPTSMRPQAPASATLDPLAVPSTLTTMPPPDEPASTSPTPSGRPAPFAGQLPEMPRPQADPLPSLNDTPGTGRPAMIDDNPARTARPQASAADRTSTPRPRAEPANPPSYRPAELPTPTESQPPAPVVVPSPVDTPPTATPPDASPPLPVELPPAPVIEPVATPPPVAATPPPIGTDPLQGMEVVATVALPVTPPAATPFTAADLIPPLPIRTDSDVKQVSQDSVQDETALRMKAPRPKALPYATLRAAAVGDQIITINELDTAVKEDMKKYVGDQAQGMSAEQFKQVRNQVAASVLNRMIDQHLILQEAKHKMDKNEKGKQQLNESIDKVWKTDEIPPLLRKYGCTNAYELKAKLASEGKSLEAMKAVFRKQFLAQSFLRNEIHNKLSCDLSEMREYYEAHQKDFEQPARMTWRKVEINLAKYPNRAAARKKAEDVLARLLHNENFEAIARSSSDGPTASKGGVYVDMQPGSYGIPVVNDELNRIPIGQVSQILEAPSSFHIIRVDSRREKGPLRFDEVQDKIRDKVFEKNFQQAVEVYLAKLRAKTLIRTMFDQTESDPGIVRRNNDPAVRTASGTK